MLAAGEMLQRECAEHRATKGALEAMKEKYDAEFEAWAEANRAADTVKERAEKLEHRIELFKNECSYVHKERNAANASLRESRAEADALRTELEEVKCNHAATANAMDAARAEVAAPSSRRSTPAPRPATRGGPRGRS